MNATFPPLAFGIIGCADIVRRKLLPALATAPSAVLTRLGSRDPARAAALLPDIAGCITSYEQVLASSDVDVVYIALPNDLHEEWTIRALRAGKHVICEKPLALSLAAAQRMLAAAEETGLLLYENIMYLHHPQHLLIREIVRSGAIGTIRSMRAAFCFTQTKPKDFRLNPAQGGGSFFDQASYPLTAALYHLQGTLGRFRGVARFRDNLDLAVCGSAITTANELFTFSIAFDQPYEAWYEIIGEQGSVRLDRAYTTPADLANTIHLQIGNRGENRQAPAADHFQLMIEHVCGLIRSGKGFTAELQQIAQRAAVTEQAYLGCIGERYA